MALGSLSCVQGRKDCRLVNRLHDLEGACSWAEVSDAEQGHGNEEDYQGFGRQKQLGGIAFQSSVIVDT